MNAPAKINSQNIASNPAERLLRLAEQDMQAVDTIILERMQSPIGMIPNLAQHLVGAGGKRLRPLLTIACARLCGYDGDHHHKLAAAVEFIHSATLLHDDVVDESQLRRGRKAANLIWGNSASILVGDFLFARAFNLMVETGSMTALDILSTASSIIAEGEVHQLASLRKISMNEDTYMHVIGAKTAALFAAACEVAPVISHSSDTQRHALKQYGQNLGLAFQLVDDVLDYGGLESALGKSVGDDFREGKLTLPVIRAIQSASPDEMVFWNRVISEHKQTDTDLERAVSILRQTGALDATQKLARHYAHQARDGLDIFPKSDWRDTLKDLADFVVERLN